MPDSGCDIAICGGETVYEDQGPYPESQEGTTGTDGGGDFSLNKEVIMGIKWE
jgi:hypothetical protein